MTYKVYSTSENMSQRFFFLQSMMQSNSGSDIKVSRLLI